MSTTDPARLARLLRGRAGLSPLRIEVTGSSMGRTIGTGSSVWVVAADRPRWGEIWAFVEDGGFVTVHRCVGRRHGLDRFWGDGNRRSDALRAPDTLVGRVVRIEGPDGVVRDVGAVERLARGAHLWVARLPLRAGTLLHRLRARRR
jgi:hypothetical protein